MQTRTWTSAVVSSTSPQSVHVARIVAMPLGLLPATPGTSSAHSSSSLLFVSSIGRSPPFPWGRWPELPIRRMVTRTPSLRRPPIGFAHRGARAHAPENTLEGFELAVRLGATGLESDVWRTSDGEAVLDHDGVVRRGLRKVPIGELRRDELPAHIPTLAEL